MLRRTEFVMTWPMMHSPNLCGTNTTSVLQVKTNRSCVTQQCFSVARVTQHWSQILTPWKKLASIFLNLTEINNQMINEIPLYVLYHPLQVLQVEQNLRNNCGQSMCKCTLCCNQLHAKFSFQKYLQYKVIWFSPKDIKPDTLNAKHKCHTLFILCTLHSKIH